MTIFEFLFKAPLKIGFGVVLALILVGCDRPEPAAENPQGSLLYVWMSDADDVDANFLMVVDADQSSANYGNILSTIPVGGIRGHAHHTNLKLPFSGFLFANDFMGNYTYIFDTNTPQSPVLSSSFGNIEDYSFPHSFAELPNGNMLVTFQTKFDGDTTPGGLLELTTRGDLVQSVDLSRGNEDLFLRPYGIILLPAADRFVVTHFDMRGADLGRHIQIFQLSNLELLMTLKVPEVEGLDVDINPFEGRVLRDGKTIMFETLSCGLYLLDGAASDTPEITYLHNFGGDYCGLPVRLGKFWVQSVEADGDEGLNAMVVMDVSDPRNPVEVNRLDFPPGFGPHWTSPDASGTRIVVTGYGSQMSRRVMMVNFDPETGNLEFDANFGSGDAFGPGLLVDQEAWNHGDTGRALAHGAIFWPPADPDWKTK
ncbi:MAG: hypothetical protein V3R64_05150 [Sphingomonadales bacterium]